MSFRYTDIRFYNSEGIKIIRKQLGVTAREVAKALDCIEMTIKNYERGRNLSSGAYSERHK